MTKSHTSLKNIHQGHDIYVLGSGSSMDFISPDFFHRKITIGANLIYKYFKVNYILFKHNQFIDDVVKDIGQLIIASKHDCGDIDKDVTKNDKIDFFFTHKRGRFGDIEKNFQDNIDAIGKDEDIFVSYSTITSCIHLAAYMGAKNIIICGHDCGWLNGKSHFKDYADRLKSFYKTEQKFEEYHNMWFERVNQDSVRLKNKLAEIYKCNIYSLNPFINFGLEGNKYDTKKH